MKRVIFIIFGIIVLFFAGVYLLYQPSEEFFPKQTVINGVDVSDLKIADAEKKLADTWSGHDFDFRYKGEVYKVPMNSITYDLSLNSIIPALTHYEKFRAFFRRENRFTVPMIPQESEEFLALIADLPFCDNTGKEKTQDAYIDLSDFEFRIVEEKIGTEVDPANIRDIAYKDIENGIFTELLTDAAIIRQPEVVVGSAALAKRLQYCKDNLSYKLEFDVNGEKEVLTPQQLEDMAVYNEDGPELNDKAIKAYIEDLAGKVNEWNSTYSFKTSGGRKINVQAVTYGRILDKDGMVKKLKKALKEQKSEEVELEWAQQTYSGGSGIGDSYIEVSIPDQHVWCYRNGECIVQCDCVTGMPGHDTVRGLYVVQYVTGPTTLKGLNDDGSSYASPVNCFIPFYAGQGLHGSNGWRSSWGGNIYLSSGSHGCVNCPDGAAKRIADNVTAGYPVVIY